MPKETRDAVLSASLPKQALTAAICVGDAPAARAFYAAGLGVREVHVVEDDEGGKVLHSHLVADAKAGGFQFHMYSEYALPGVRAGAKGAVSAFVEVPDCDLAVRRMEAAGAEVLAKCEDMHYGMRVGKVIDPFACVWFFAHVLARDGEGPKN
jgi:uncharacterized glyoxalase superfamily protein PhnB